MDEKKPLLSICIPTYNRAEYLDKSIASIVSQNEFNSEDVELVISDNASNDNTGEVVRKYQERYKNIFYSKNEENNMDRNFPTVICKAHGVFRKLCNDTLIFMDESINYMLSIIKDNIDKKPILFFMNYANRRRRRKKYTAVNFDSFIKVASFWTTWIGGFGIWEDDFEGIENKFDGCEIHLWQTKILLEIVARKKVSIIDNVQLFSTQECQKKNLNYGLFQIFYSNYLGLYHQYLMKRILSDDVFEYLRKHLLFDFFLGWIVNFHFDYIKYEITTDDDTAKLILHEYRHNKYYFYFCLKLRINFFKRYITDFIKGKFL